MTFSKIPGELKERGQWVVWRREEHSGRVTKVPYQATNPARKASSTHPATWNTFPEAVAAVDQADGIGFVFTADDPYVGVDFDELTPATSAAARLLDSYTEVSVSGRGLHVLLKGSLDGVGRNRHGKVEVYQDGRYFCMTGQHIEGSPTTVEERQGPLEDFVSEFLPAKAPLGAAAAPASTVADDDLRLLDTMFGAKNGRPIRQLWQGDWSRYGSHSEADLALCNHLAFYTGRDAPRMDALFRQSGLYREKWARADYRSATLEAAISRTQEVYRPASSQPALVGETRRSAGQEEPGPPPIAVIDWGSFWDHDHTADEWVYPEVLARGRGHAIFASHKVGKSLLMLCIAAELATGDQPIVVLYLDYEMTEADVQERLEDMGYGPETDLSRLLYALLPTLPPLDSAAGGEALLEMTDHVERLWPDHHLLVVIDTISRAVAGKENDSDTVRDFYAHTGLPLKRRGTTWVRLDHGGKDPDLGQRGTSAKGDDVDVVWQLKPAANGLVLKRFLSRIGWVPEQVRFTKTDEPFGFRRMAVEWPSGTESVANHLDDLGVPLNASTRDALAALRSADEGKRRQVVVAAMRWRRERTQRARNNRSAA